MLFLADISNSGLNADVFKAIASGQNSVTITEKSKALDIEIKGKPVLLLTSAFPNPSQELLRRFPILSLTETTAQTKKILGFHGARESTAKKKKHNQKLRLALDYLEEFSVIVPFAEAVASLFSDSLPARTYFTRLIDYMKASAVLHQRTRKKKQEDEDVFLIAEQQDYELGVACFLSTCLTSMLVPLTGQQRQLVQFFSEDGAASFSFSELREKQAFAAIPERTLRRQLEKMVSMGIIEVHTDRIEGSIRPVQFYTFKAFTAITLPTWEEIQAEWQNRQNGTTTTTNNMTEQANLAEQEKNEGLTQSAQSAQNAMSNPLQAPIDINTAKPAACELCGQPAEKRFGFALNGKMFWVCRTCIEKERRVQP